MSCSPSSSLKEKEKEIQKKRNIKSRKIDRRKRKMLVSKAFHNISNMKHKMKRKKKKRKGVKLTTRKQYTI